MLSQVVAVDADTEFGIRYSIVDLPSNTHTNSSSSRSLSPGTKRDSAYFEINPESGELRLRMSDQDVIKFLKVCRAETINTNQMLITIIMHLNISQRTRLEWIYSFGS